MSEYSKITKENGTIGHKIYFSIVF